MNESNVGCRWRQFGLFIFVSSVAFLLGLCAILRRPDLFNSASYVLGEHGNQLWRAYLIHLGKLPYRDFALQYGPLPTYVFAIWTSVFHTTIRSNLFFHLTMSVLTIGLVFRMVCGVVDRKIAAAFTIIFMIPVLVVPLSTGAHFNIEYLSFERLCLVGIALSWQPPTTRLQRRNLGLGFILGAWQWVKFGGAFFGGIAIVCVDVVWILNSKPDERNPRKAFSNFALIAIGFTAIELLRLSAIFSTSSGTIAVEAAFPLYVRQSYADAPQRFPTWSGMPYFFGQQFLPLSAFFLGAVGIALVLSRQKTVPSEKLAKSWGFAIFLGFFVCAAPIYFGHVHLWNQHAWELCPAACLLLAQVRSHWRFALFGCGIPAWILMLKIVLSTPSPITSLQMTLPDGEIIHTNKDERLAIQALSTAARLCTDSGHILIFSSHWGGGGFHYFYDKDYELRNYMIDSIAFRSFDVEQLKAAFNRVGAILEYKTDLDPLKSLLGSKSYDELSSEFEDTDAKSRDVSIRILKRSNLQIIPLP